MLPQLIYVRYKYPALPMESGTTEQNVAREIGIKPNQPCSSLHVLTLNYKKKIYRASIVIFFSVI